MSVPTATVRPLDTLSSTVPPVLAFPLDAMPPMMKKAPLMLKSEVVPQMYKGGNVTKISFVDENSKWELLSLLGNWYKPDTFDSVFSSIASDAVFFSS